MTILRDIQLFLHRSGMTETRFGRLAVRDPRLVRDLRCGRELRARTERRIRAFIAAQVQP